MDDFVLMAKNMFDSLAVGTAVEIQWKFSTASPHYNWWYAVVQEVHSYDDEVTLRFEQYDADHPEHSKLLRVATVLRTGGSLLHGGLTGGLRKCTPEDIRLWQVRIHFRKA
jgi:hypothetical protein